MCAFTLDTSGEVYWRTPDGDLFRTKWADLDPFTQGYVEALFAELADRVFIPPDERDTDSAFRAAAFSDLSPSALERIVRDCGERCRLAPQWARAGASHDGCRFWEMRQRETMRMTFPPLTVSLDDAGQVTLADRVQA